jgi:hypothetical protein
MHDRCSQLCSYDLSLQNLLLREDGSISGLPGAIAYISVYAARRPMHLIAASGCNIQRGGCVNFILTQTCERRRVLAMTSCYS